MQSTSRLIVSEGQNRMKINWHRMKIDENEFSNSFLGGNLFSVFMNFKMSNFSFAQ